MYQLIKRNTPALVNCFVLNTIEKENGKSVYTVGEQNGKIALGGDCKISLAMAYYRYLREYCGVQLSHCGSTDLSEITQAPLPKAEIHQVILQDKRVGYSYAFFGNTAAFWDWERWEKEIDFMAMQGINMPLSLVGSEATWFYTMREYKYTESAALSYLTGPGFWFRQLLGNVCSYFPLSDKQYIDARLALGQQIVQRQAELGMTPILPGFNGVVPRSVNRLFRNARLRIKKEWQNFPVTYYLEPTDPAFRKFGLAFLEKQRQLFGAYHYYSVDLFYDTNPNSKQKNFLWNCGRSVDNLLKEFDAESVWVMQSHNIYEQMIKSVPAGRLLMLDLNGKKYAETEGFWGHDFVLGNAHDKGDRNVLHGNIRSLANNPYLGVKEQYPNCCGTGIFSEGLSQNPLYYALAFQMLTEDKKINLSDWLGEYARRRYDSEHQNLIDALKILADTCYGENTDIVLGSLLCARPSVNLQHTAPHDTLQIPYDNKKLLQAAVLLLQSECTTRGYIYDAADITRQVLSNYINSLYAMVTDAYNRKDVNAFERATNQFIKVAEDMDALLQTLPALSLSAYLQEANARAFTDKERQNFELNLLTRQTLWGPVNKPVLYDYAWKEWGGMVGSYYAARWHSYFEQLAVFFKKRHFTTQTKKQIEGRNVYGGNTFYRNFEKFEKNWLSTVNPAPCSEESTVAKAADLLKKYGNAIENA